MTIFVFPHSYEDSDGSEWAPTDDEERFLKSEEDPLEGPSSGAKSQTQPQRKRQRQDRPQPQPPLRDPDGPQPQQPEDQGALSYWEPPAGWVLLEGSLWCSATGRLVDRSKLYRHQCAGCPLRQHRRNLVSYQGPLEATCSCGTTIRPTKKVTFRKMLTEHFRQTKSHQAMDAADREEQVRRLLRTTCHDYLPRVRTTIMHSFVSSC